MATESEMMKINSINSELSSQEDYIKNELNIESDDILPPLEDENDDVNNSQSTRNIDQPDNDEKLEWMDILGNGQLRKKTLTKNLSGKTIRPNQGDFCTISFVGRLEDGTVVEEVYDSVIQLGDHEIVQGLDLAIALMNVGETAQIEVAGRFAYGDLGRKPDIPSDTKIIYDVILKKIEMEQDIHEMDFTQRLSLGNKKREKGNWWFSRGEPTTAIQCYRRALEYLVPPPSSLSNDENAETKDKNNTESNIHQELEILLENRTKVYNNLAAAQLKTEAYEAASESVENVLRVEPKNVKALFRKGRILHKKGEYTDAMAALVEASKLDPDSKIINQELSILREKNARNSVYEKNLYRKMLGTSKSDCKSITKNSAQKYTSLLYSADKKQGSKLAIWSMIGGALATVTGIVVYKFTF